MWPQHPPDKSTGEATKTDAAKLAKLLSNMVFTVIINTSVLATNSLTNSFYIDYGASAHLVPTMCSLRNYVKFASPLEIAAVNNGKIHAYGSGTAWVTMLINGIKCKVNLEDAYYVPGVHVQLLSLGKLKSQEWVVCLKDRGMELWDKRRDLFAIISSIK